MWYQAVRRKAILPATWNPPPHPHAGCPTGSTYQGNLSNHYPSCGVIITLPAAEPRLNATARARSNVQTDKIRAARQSRGNPIPAASADDHVVVVAGAQTLKHRGSLLRLDQRQITQEGKYVFRRLQPRSHKRNLNILMMKMPSERCRQANGTFVSFRRQYAGRRIIKHNAQLALIFAAEFAHLQRTCTSRRLPVDVSSGVVRHVFANEIKVVAPSAHKSFKLARYHRKNFEKLIGRLHSRIDNHFASQIDAPRLRQESKRKACGHAKVPFTEPTS